VRVLRLTPYPVHACCWLIAGALIGVNAPGADDSQYRRVEEELRRRKLYFGNIDGEANPEVTESIRRFQESKGFYPSGRIDDETLRALGLLPPATLRSPGSTRVQQSRDFVESYLRASERNDDGTARYYADRVDYFDDGLCERSELLARERERRKQWPDRKFSLVRFVASPHGSDSEAIIVTYRYRYVVRNEQREITGTEDNTVILRAAGPELRIAAMKAAR
jgi:hypothetical protein